MTVGSELTRALLVSRSIELISTHQSPSGAYPASPTFSAYRGYAWLRDGAFIAEGMSRAGQADSATAFHAWCAEVIGVRAAQVDALIARADAGQELALADMLPTRFTLDGADGADQWWDHQLDGYGIWLWALERHAVRHGAPVPGPAVAVAVRYLSRFWDRPCYDWWEEHVDRRHVSTLGAIHAGLRAALALGVLDRADAHAAQVAVAGVTALVAGYGVAPAGHLRKWLDDGRPTADPATAPAVFHTAEVPGDAVDASLLACVYPFGLYPPGHPVATATVAAVQDQLARGYGVHRYLADTFYGGGRWILLAGLLGLNHAAAGRREEALRHLDWMAAQATPAGELPEQVSDVLLAPDRLGEWLERWGPVATPLLWSHGMYLILADELGVMS
ncbi:glycoside hydrolase family 15 protein [Acrocarpospora catenulata]|uniref:glycoside hydrolase family 15 protein n=1 Tax=Acrocarpospora catenulata TaxID=2836182 RepID=UPI001BD914C1|nr:glycoside hydrolase family 15 protein [Acrocarpospora catenulata]